MIPKLLVDNKKVLPVRLRDVNVPEVGEIRDGWLGTRRSGGDYETQQTASPGVSCRSDSASRLGAAFGR